MEQQAQIYAIVLSLRGGSWRVNLNPGGAEGGIPITVAQAESIAKVIGDNIGVDQQPSAFEIVRSGTATLKEALKRQLEEAETKAASVAGLRRALQEIEGS